MATREGAEMEFLLTWLFGVNYAQRRPHYKITIEPL